MGRTHQFYICDSFQFFKKEIGRRILKHGALLTDKVSKDALIQKLENKYMTNAQTAIIFMFLPLLRSAPQAPELSETAVNLINCNCNNIKTPMTLFFLSFFLSSFIEK